MATYGVKDFPWEALRYEMPYYESTSLASMLSLANHATIVRKQQREDNEQSSRQVGLQLVYNMSIPLAQDISIFFTIKMISMSLIVRYSPTLVVCY
jgi:hypothetical protein